MEEFVMKPFFNGGALILRNLKERRPAVYRAVMAVLPEAVKYVREHEHEARMSLVKHIGVTDPVAEGALIDQFLLIDQIDLNNAQRVADILYEHGVVAKKINAASMFR
jgi:ABC-type nitrate/sulfonate/bicarbonate transport system substrate-binding protein